MTRPKAAKTEAKYGRASVLASGNQELGARSQELGIEPE